MKLSILPVAIVSLALIFACGEKPVPVDYASLSEEDKHKPENALASMTVAKGLTVQMFASEPMITNPTNMAIDAKGRIWICEGYNYRNWRNTNNPYKKEGDRILILEDTDGDGTADNTKVFYQGEDVNAALGIAVLGNKVIVSCSPNVFVFTDEDGDDKPDKKEVLFTGLGGEQHDHAAHAFSFGADGRLYFNFGNEGGQLVRANGDTVVDKFGNKIISDLKPLQQGIAFRMEEDGSDVEALGWNFRNPYEIAVDANGTLWQSDNDDDGNKGVRINFVMEYGNYGYRDEISGAGWRTRRPGMHEEIPKRHWFLNDPGVVPNLLQTGSGSPCGILIYEGDMLPAQFHRQMIHAEPGHHVVRSYVTQKDGAGYKAEIVNILESMDPWFRPSDVTVAPDGSLFICDWYDPGVGGHLVEDLPGGRIYRVTAKEEYKPVSFDVSNPVAATEGLLSPNQDIFYQSWKALQAFGAEAETALVSLLDKGGVAKARALWLLARIEGKTEENINRALSDKDEDIRVQGLRMARYLANDQMATYIEKITDDPSAQVRREGILALRHFDGQQGAALWTKLASQYDGADRWYLEALGIGADLNKETYFAAWMEQNKDTWETAAGKDIIWRMRAPATVDMTIAMIKDPVTDKNTISKLIRSLHFKAGENKDDQMASLLNTDHPEKDHINALALGQISPEYFSTHPGAVKTAKSILPNISGTYEWLAAIRALKAKDQNGALLEAMLHHEDNDFQNASMQTLIQTGGLSNIEKYIGTLTTDADLRAIFSKLGRANNDGAVDLLEKYYNEKKYSYPVMTQIVEAMGSTWAGQIRLFGLLKEDKLEERYKNTAVLRLMNSWNPEIRSEAPKYLAAAAGKDGASLPSIEELVEKRGNTENGKKVFADYCAACHQVGAEGVNYGPALTEIGSKLARKSMYSAILYPSAGINFGYEGYTIKTKEGAVYTGYISSQTETEITLTIMGGTTQVISRNDIDKMDALDYSLMTENLQVVMGEENLVDLVEYLMTLKAQEATE